MENKKLALITGAAGGIGCAIARKLKDDGFDLALHARNLKPELEALKNELEDDGCRVQIVLGDISSFEDCKRMIDEILAENGSVDVLVNNAGMTRDKLVMMMKAEDFTDVIDTNLNGTFYLSKLVSKSMMKKRAGRIINMSSVVGIHGNAGQANYAASKAGIIGLTKSFAKEFASRNILVNAIAPGFIVSPMTDMLSEKVKEEIKADIPLAELGRAEDVAELVSFLAGDSSRYITGQVICVDGGMSI
ncbi:MAG: 3-oxoacyl-[acyl-carrier-protein] reductase [Candidatus Alectryocaccobium sp.]|jgi:3-oxoacyl-[acyl-carrier protein] reductase|nr:3-oxoacyl-[acyl-carrier-protein] reductase [Candidatus Alectryocaccobium sp.]